MELHNRAGDITQLADNLTLKEVVEMGFSIDLCDKSYDPKEHWMTDEQDQQKRRKEFPEN